MFKNLLISISKAFKKHEIPYIIIGGQAVLLYGEPRLTKDIDITVGLNIDALDKILNIMVDIGTKPLPKNLKHFVRETMVLPLVHQESGIRIDIIFSFSDFEKTAIQRANKITLEDTEVQFVSLEDLIVFKVFSGRNRDLEDARIILQKNKQADIDQIRNDLIHLSYDHHDFEKRLKQLLESI